MINNENRIELSIETGAPRPRTRHMVVWYGIVSFFMFFIIFYWVLAGLLLKDGSYPPWVLLLATGLTFIILLPIWKASSIIRYNRGTWAIGTTSIWFVPVHGKKQELTWESITRIVMSERKGVFEGDGIVIVVPWGWFKGMRQTCIDAALAHIKKRTALMRACTFERSRRANRILSIMIVVIALICIPFLGRFPMVCIVILIIVLILTLLIHRKQTVKWDEWSFQRTVDSGEWH
jgi:hypothetical protein